MAATQAAKQPSAPTQAASSASSNVSASQAANHASVPMPVASAAGRVVSATASAPGGQAMTLAVHLPPSEARLSDWASPFVAFCGVIITALLSRQQVRISKDQVQIAESQANTAASQAAIAKRQAVIATNKYALELFDKRMDVYKAAIELLSTIVSNGDVTQEQLGTYLRATHPSRWLFDSKVGHYFEKTLFDQVLALQLFNAQRMTPERLTQQGMAERTHLIAWFSQQFDEVRQMLDPFMHLERTDLLLPTT